MLAARSTDLVDTAAKILVRSSAWVRAIARRVKATRAQRRLADEGRATDPRNSLANN